MKNSAVKSHKRVNVLPQLVMSFHGGGARGLLSAVLCSAIEKKFHAFENGQVTVLAGTSTGSIIAAALGLGITPEDVVLLYEENLPKIFPKWRRIPRDIWLLGKLISPFLCYDNQKLRDCLKKAFNKLVPSGTNDEPKLSDCNTRIIVVAVCLDDFRPIVFDSSNPEHANYSLFDVITASCSAPFFFKPYTIPDVNGFDYRYVDGGLAANNPSLCAVDALIRDGTKVDSIGVISIGTGIYSEYNPSKSLLLTPFKPIKTGVDTLSACINSNAIISEKVCESIVTSDRYVSVNAVLSEDLKLDGAYQRELKKLKHIANRTFDNSLLHEQIKSVIDELAG